MATATTELEFLVLIFALFVAPRALQRLLLPAPLTCFAFGMLAALLFGLGKFSHDTTLALLATLGISSLFLFAGLEVEFRALRRRVAPLLGHLAVRSVALAIVTLGAMRLFALPWQAACLLALALLTPSTGFILETLPRLGLGEKECFWVTTKAIGGELLALLVLFVVLQSGSVERMAWASAALAALVALLPVLFTLLARFVLPYAPGSEFSLLLMVSMLAAYLTKELGAYYLVGAFLVGLIARLSGDRMPALASKANVHAIKLFSSFFVPFYFFSRGVSVPQGALLWQSLWLGIGLTAAVLPFRIGIVWAQRRILVREGPRSSLRIAVALAPTLIFTLVLAGILRERFDIPDTLYGALLVYAALTTLLPSVTLSRPFDLDIDDVDAPLPGWRPAEPARSEIAQPEAVVTDRRGDGAPS